MADKKDPIAEVFDRLAEPFGDADIEWRVGQSGMKSGRPWAVLLPYIDGRAIQRRLDDVVGPAYWQDEYRQVVGNDKESGFVCRLSVEVEGKTIVKEGASPFTNIEGLKGAESGSLKRAAVKFGIGRHLYDAGDHFAHDIREGYPKRGVRAVSITTGKGGDKKTWWCLPPSLSGLNGADPADRELLIERLSWRIATTKTDAVAYLTSTLETIAKRDGKKYTYLSDLPLNRIQQWTESLNKELGKKPGGESIGSDEIDQIMNKTTPVGSK